MFVNTAKSPFRGHHAGNQLSQTLDWEVNSTIEHWDEKYTSLTHALAVKQLDPRRGREDLKVIAGQQSKCSHCERGTLSWETEEVTSQSWV